ncbi:hypothetical protein AC578_10550 [Pseudocercospora eumusae]|uniref:Uncharacterized protein n=1 Tax=Pseudocercospora eumusae TaxID=321146 RepID=A0A139H635_9PEZI|nr:hypothetical protein AC578_10550 [Pseudocercospora eumusae]
MDIAPPRRYTSPNPWTPPSQQKPRSSSTTTTTTTASANIRNDEIPSSPTQLLAPTQLKRISEASELAHEEGDPPTSPSRPSKRFSWVSGWSFAGEKSHRHSKIPSSSNDNDNENEAPPDERRTSVAQRMTRRFSSIGESWLFNPEPSHEKNFPPSLEFPTDEGRKLCLSVFGTLDFGTGTGTGTSSMMKLQIPKGRVCHADEQVKEYKAVLEFLGPKLKNGDVLVRPFMARYSRDPKMAMVVRGTMQDYVFKCFVVGVFPMKVFGEEMPVPYAMDVQLY